MRPSILSLNAPKTAEKEGARSKPELKFLFVGSLSSFWQQPRISPSYRDASRVWESKRCLSRGAGANSSQQARDKGGGVCRTPQTTCPNITCNPEPRAAGTPPHRAPNTAWHPPFLSPLEEPGQGGGTDQLAPSHPSVCPCLGQHSPALKRQQAQLLANKPTQPPGLGALLPWLGATGGSGEQASEVSRGRGRPHSAELELPTGTEQAGGAPCDGHTRCWGTVAFLRTPALDQAQGSYGQTGRGQGGLHLFW